MLPGWPAYVFVQYNILGHRTPNLADAPSSTFSCQRLVGKRTTVAAILAGEEQMVDLVEAKDAMVLAERELEARKVWMEVKQAREEPGELE